LVNSASEKLSRSPLQILETVPATKRALSFQQSDLSNAS
jgi:hypothetical protein